MFSPEFRRNFFCLILGHYRLNSRNFRMNSGESLLNSGEFRLNSGDSPEFRSKKKFKIIIDFLKKISHITQPPFFCGPCDPPWLTRSQGPYWLGRRDLPRFDAWMKLNVQETWISSSPIGDWPINFMKWWWWFRRMCFCFTAPSSGNGQRFVGRLFRFRSHGLGGSFQPRTCCSSGRSVTICFRHKRFWSRRRW